MTHTNGTSTDVVFFQGAGPTLFQQPDAEVQMPHSPVPNPHSQVLALAQGEWSLWVLSAVKRVRFFLIDSLTQSAYA